MAIQIEIDGILKTVTKEELFSLAASGTISPTTPIEVNGKRGTANRVTGIVFGQSVPVFERSPIPPAPPSPRSDTYQFDAFMNDVFDDISIPTTTSSDIHQSDRKLASENGHSKKAVQIPKSPFEVGKRSYGEMVGIGSFFSWLTDFAFNDIRLPAINLFITRVLYVIDFVLIHVCAILGPLFLVFALLCNSSVYEAPSALFCTIFSTLLLWIVCAIALVFARLLLEWFLMLVDLVVETTKAARIYIAEHNETK
ncbi:MAG: hypothetical protein ACRC2T_02595 [Thermoguttaceae bacterium]